LPSARMPVDILTKLTEFPSYEEEGMRRCSEFILNEMESFGFNVETDKLGNVYGEKTFDGDGTFLVNAHFDTVTSTPRWTRNPLEATPKDDRIYGLGTSDDKGSVAAILHVLQRMQNCRFRKLEILFSNYEDNSAVVDGETWLGTPYFLAHHKIEAKSGINVEGTVKEGRLSVSIGCGGRVGFTVTTLGKEAHSSDPRKGRNAIYDMVKVIEALRQLQPARMTMDGQEAYTELNVNKIQGGVALNIVPGECTINCERRVLPNENWETVKGKVEETLGKVRDVNFKVTYSTPQKSYLGDRTHPTVTLAMESIEKVLGYTPQVRVESGRTDSTYLNEAGIKTVILGPGETAHIADEYINVNRLEEFTRVLYQMLKNPAS